MNLLFINSNENDAFAAVYADDKLHVASSSQFTDGNMKIGRSPDKLINCLVNLRARFDFGPLDAIAVTIGPGSFTGIRVGLSLAKGIAGASGKPLIPINNFELLYEKIPDKDTGKKYCILLPAKLPEYYYSIMQNALQLESGCLKIDEIVEKTYENTVFAGNFDNESILKHRYFAYTDLTKSEISEPAAMLALAKKYYSEGKSRPVEDVEPLYLKDFQFKKSN